MPDDQLAERCEANRPHLRAVAIPMLGSPAEADDAVQEAWLRLSRSDTGGVDNLTGWPTTPGARVLLDSCAHVPHGGKRRCPTPSLTTLRRNPHRSTRPCW